MLLVLFAVLLGSGSVHGCYVSTNDITDSNAYQYQGCTELTGYVSIDSAYLSYSNFVLAFSSVTYVEFFQISNNGFQWSNMSALNALRNVSSLTILDYNYNQSGLNYDGLDGLESVTVLRLQGVTPPFRGLQLVDSFSIYHIVSEDEKPLNASVYAHVNFGFLYHLLVWGNVIGFEELAVSANLRSLYLLENPFVTNVDRLLRNVIFLEDFAIEGCVNLISVTIPAQVDVQQLRVSTLPSLVSFSVIDRHDGAVRGERWSFYQFMVLQQLFISVNVERIYINGLSQLINFTYLGTNIITLYIIESSVMSVSMPNVVNIFELYLFGDNLNTLDVCNVTSVTYVYIAAPLSCDGLFYLINVWHTSYSMVYTCLSATHYYCGGPVLASTAAAGTGGSTGAGTGAGYSYSSSAASNGGDMSSSGSGGLDDCGVFSDGFCQVGYGGPPSCCERYSDQQPVIDAYVSSSNDMIVFGVSTASVPGDYSFTFGISNTTTVVATCAPQLSINWYPGYYEAGFFIPSLIRCVDQFLVSGGVQYQGYFSVALEYTPWAGTNTYIGLWFYQLTVRSANSVSVVSLLSVTPESVGNPIDIVIEPTASLKHCTDVSCALVDPAYFSRVGDTEIYRVSVTGPVQGTAVVRAVVFEDRNHNAVTITTVNGLYSVGFNTTFSFVVPEEANAYVRYLRVLVELDYSQNQGSGLVSLAQPAPLPRLVASLTTFEILGTSGAISAAVAGLSTFVTTLLLVSFFTTA